MRRKVGGTRKHSRKHTTHRRRGSRRRHRLGAANDIGGAAMKVLGLVSGAVAARELNTLAVKFFPSLNATMSGLMQIAVGYFLPKMAKGSFIANMGDGMMAFGGQVVIVSTGLISGIGAGNTMTYRLNGTPFLPAVGAGTARLPVVSGQTRINQGAIPMQPGTAVRRDFRTYGE